MRWIFILLVFLLISTGIRAQKVTVAAASSTHDAMKKIAAAFKKNTGITCELVFSSSGKLTAQIRQGAPFDVFVSANTFYPQKLMESGQGHGADKVYARGQLVLISQNPLKKGNGLNTILQYEKIALANPKIAPYGQLAKKALKDHGMYLR